MKCWCWSNIKQSWSVIWFFTILISEGKSHRNKKKWGFNKHVIHSRIYLYIGQLWYRLPQSWGDIILRQDPVPQTQQVRSSVWVPWDSYHGHWGRPGAITVQQWQSSTQAGAHCPTARPRPETQLPYSRWTEFSELSLRFTHLIVWNRKGRKLRISARKTASTSPCA